MKAKLTKAQRLADYKKVLERLKREENSPGICILLAIVRYGSFINGPYNSSTIEDWYPEFYAQKPSRIINPHRSWFKGQPQRIKAIKAAIKLATPKPKSHE